MSNKDFNDLNFYQKNMLVGNAEGTDNFSGNVPMQVDPNVPFNQQALDMQPQPQNLNYIKNLIFSQNPQGQTYAPPNQVNNFSYGEPILYAHTQGFINQPNLPSQNFNPQPFTQNIEQPIPQQEIYKQPQQPQFYEGKPIENCSVVNIPLSDFLHNRVMDLPEVVAGVRRSIKYLGKTHEILIRSPITTEINSEFNDKIFISSIYSRNKHLSVDGAEWDNKFFEQVHYYPYTRIVLIDNIPFGIFTIDKIKMGLSAYLNGLISLNLPNGQYSSLGVSLFKNSNLFDIILEAIKNMDLNIYSLNIEIPKFLEIAGPLLNTDDLIIKEKSKRLSKICEILQKIGFEKRSNLKDEAKKFGRRISVSTYQLRINYYKNKRISHREAKAERNTGYNSDSISTNK